MIRDRSYLVVFVDEPAGPVHNGPWRIGWRRREAATLIAFRLDETFTAAWRANSPDAVSVAS